MGTVCTLIRIILMAGTSGSTPWLEEYRLTVIRFRLSEIIPFSMPFSLYYCPGIRMPLGMK